MTARVREYEVATSSVEVETTRKMNELSKQGFQLHSWSIVARGSYGNPQYTALMYRHLDFNAVDDRWEPVHETAS